MNEDPFDDFNDSLTTRMGRNNNRPSRMRSSRMRSSRMRNMNSMGPGIYEGNGPVRDTFIDQGRSNMMTGPMASPMTGTGNSPVLDKALLDRARPIPSINNIPTWLFAMIIVIGIFALTAFVIICVCVFGGEMSPFDLKVKDICIDGFDVVKASKYIISYQEAHAGNLPTLTQLNNESKC